MRSDSAIGGTYAIAGYNWHVHRLALVASIAACTHAAPPATPAPPRTRLDVLIVIDQLPTSELERDRHLYRGGLARLLRDGAYATTEVPYASTFTAPGHATIGTGVLPRAHGIVGNDWYRRDEKRIRPAEWDPGAPPLVVGPAEGGEVVDGGASGVALEVDGIADHLRGHGKSVAIAIKARAAVVMAGRHPDLAIWYEPGAGGMTTSTAYAKVPPPWLVALAKVKPVSRFFTATWEALDAALLARETAIADDGPGEANQHALGRAFPHRLALTTSPARAFLQTPYADEVVLDTAYAALDDLDLGADSTDLLALSFAAHDFAGHAWGPDSWEELDLTLRLDAALGKFFAHLDQRFGKDGYAVVLTSDHGVTPLPERSHVKGARRILPFAIEGVVGDAIGADKVDKLVSQNLYLEPGADLDAAAAAAGAVPNIARAVRTDRACAAGGDQLAVLICNAIVPGRGGDIYVVPERGSIVSEYATGTHHDAPFEDNRFVPLIVMARGVVPTRTTASLLQVAPTVERLLGLPATGALVVR